MRINNKNTDRKIVSQYYYFIDDTKNKKFNLIQFFSPYQLTSESSYEANDGLYMIQAEINIDLIKVQMARLVEEHKGYFTYQFIEKNKITDKISVNLTPFQSGNNGFYQASIDTDLFNIRFTLDKKYFDNDLSNILIKLLFLNLILLILSYAIIVQIIDQQIIFPITTLAKSIKKVEASLAVDLKPLNTHDEVSDLNESYISLINKINNLANNDPLTGLSNRGSFNETLSSMLAINKENETYIALFFIDLDDFKYVNDTFGHDTGDSLLIVFSQRLKAILRADDRLSTGKEIKSVARLGGDEFVVLINELPSIDAIESIGKRICTLFDDGFTIANDTFNVHASIGIAYSNDPINNGERLLNRADKAMYLAKRQGKNNYKLFTAEIADKMRNEKIIERQLIDALNNHKLCLVFMPTYTATTLTLKGYEVLLRCPTLSDIGIGPETFITIAEKTDLILRIDLWVAENALMRLKELIKKTGFSGFFEINVSSKSLRNEQFYIHLKALIDNYKVNVKQIELEITETCLMPDDKKAIASLKQLKSLGVRIAIDDFGTGYTSFSQLVNYPLDTLKIDRSFVQDLGDTPVGKKPTLDIIDELAKVYQLAVIVEGIETKMDLDHVKMLGCDMVQGFYFSIPYAWNEVLDECTN